MATTKVVGKAQDGTEILEVTCDSCSATITCTGDPEKVSSAVERHQCSKVQWRTRSEAWNSRI